MAKAIAAMLATEMRAQGWTQSALAPVVGISQSQLSKYLRGERTMSIDELDAMCLALHLPIVKVVSRANRAR